MNKAIIVAIFALFCVLSSASASMLRPRRPVPIEKFQDHNLGALNVGVNAGNNGFGANAGYQGNIGRNGNWNVGGQIQTNPGGRPNWGVNAGMTMKFDDEAQDNNLAAFEEFQDNNLDALKLGVNAGNNGFGANAGYQRDFKNGNWNVGGQIQTNPGGRPNWGVNAGLTMKFDDEAQDNNLAAFEEFQDNNLDAFNMGVNAGNNGFGANAGYQKDFRNGNWNVGGQIQTNPGGRPNWGVNAGLTMKFDDEAQDNNLAAFEEFQDNNLDAFNMGVNAGNNGFGANAGYQKDFRNGNWNVGGQIQTNPGGRPNWNVNAGMTMKFDEEQ